MRHLSHSSIHLYLECPQKYKFKYIESIPEAPKHFFSFGKTVHSALEFLYTQTLFAPPTLDELLSYYEKTWNPAGFESKEQEQKYRAEGRRIITEYYKTYMPDFKPAMYVEYPFTIDIEGVQVKGVMDRIDKLDSGKLAITDYKTGKPFDLTRVQKDPQLTLYQYVAEQNIGLPVEKLTLFHLGSLTPFTVAPHTQNQIDELKKTIVDVASRIVKEDFKPDPGDHCRWCDYKKLCPVFAFEFDAHKDSKTFTVKDIEKIIDAYGELKSKASAFEDQSKDLKKDIEKYLIEKNYLRACGEKFEVSLSRKSAWKFEDDAIKDVLRELNLWDRVLKYDSRAVEKLAEDDKLPEATLKKIRSVGKLTETGTLRYKSLDKNSDE